MNELSRRIGKFESPESLLKAYESLEAEFTKRSQKLRELEKANEKLSFDLADTERHNSYALAALECEDFVKQNVLTKESLKKAVIENYLEGIARGETVNLLGGGIGTGALTPPARPTSLSEAKLLADKIINS